MKNPIIREMWGGEQRKAQDESDLKSLKIIPGNSICYFYEMRSAYLIVRRWTLEIVTRLDRQDKFHKI
jgi:hypothetical protein